MWNSDTLDFSKYVEDVPKLLGIRCIHHVFTVYMGRLSGSMHYESIFTVFIYGTCQLYWNNVGNTADWLPLAERNFIWSKEQMVIKVPQYSTLIWYSSTLLKWLNLFFFCCSLWWKIICCLHLTNSNDRIVQVVENSTLSDQSERFVRAQCSYLPVGRSHCLKPERIDRQKH